jgi:hypothetical protein
MLPSGCAVGPSPRFAYVDSAADLDAVLAASGDSEVDVVCTGGHPAASPAWAEIPPDHARVNMRAAPAKSAQDPARSEIPWQHVRRLSRAEVRAAVAEAQEAAAAAAPGPAGGAPAPRPAGAGIPSPHGLRVPEAEVLEALAAAAAVSPYAAADRTPSAIQRAVRGLGGGARLAARIGEVKPRTARQHARGAPEGRPGPSQDTGAQR